MQSRGTQGKPQKQLRVLCAGLCLFGCGSPNSLQFDSKTQLNSLQKSREKENISDPLWNSQWYFFNPASDAHIHMPSAWNTIPLQEDVLLAVLDSGYDANHPDFDPSRIFTNAGEWGLDPEGRDKATNGIDDDKNGLVDDVHGWSFAENSPKLTDTLGHGTHVMGVLAAQTNNNLGIAAPWQNFKVLPIQIFSGAHPSPSNEQIASAIRYAVQMGAKVISASFGSPTPSPTIEAAIRFAELHDVVFVSAVGNFRKNLDFETNYPSGYGFSNQISVGATNASDIASTFTNFGKSIDIFAPGENILSLKSPNEYAYRSGTSQACPLVAATAAAIRSQNPMLQAPQVKEILLNGGDELSGLVGFGKNSRRLNVQNALAKAEGVRLPHYNFSSWDVLEFKVESEHPYRGSQNVRIPVKAPTGATRFRMHFSRINTQSSDTISILNSNNTPIITYSGSMSDLWSPVIEKPNVVIEFSTDKFVSDWGFAIDAMQFAM